MRSSPVSDCFWVGPISCERLEWGAKLTFQKLLGNHFPASCKATLECRLCARHLVVETQFAVTKSRR